MNIYNILYDLTDISAKQASLVRWCQGIKTARLHIINTAHIIYYSWLINSYSLQLYIHICWCLSTMRSMDTYVLLLYHVCILCAAFLVDNVFDSANISVNSPRLFFFSLLKFVFTEWKHSKNSYCNFEKTVSAGGLYRNYHIATKYSNPLISLYVHFALFTLTLCSIYIVGYLYIIVFTGASENATLLAERHVGKCQRKWFIII